MTRNITRAIDERLQVQEQLEARLRQQAAVVELGHRALSGAHFSSLLEDAVATVTGALQLELCSVFELLPDSDALLLRAGVGWSPELIGRARIPGGTGSQAGYALLRNEPVIFDDLRKETRFEAPDILLQHGIVSGAVVPIPGHARPFGALSVLSTALCTFTRDDVLFLQSVSNLIAAAIERQLLEKEVLEMGERERRRIGQDLHDGLCQHLVAAGLMAYSLERSLSGAGRTAAESDAKKAADIARMLREGASQARQIAQGLLPLDAEALGLVAALRELSRTVRKCTGIRCRFRADEGAVVRDPFVAGHLFRIAQESVQNAIKHSRAERISVALEVREGAIRLTVRDDGVGLPPSDKLNGSGLRTMKYRAAMINARLSVSSGKAGKAGTTVRCTLPAPPAAD